MDKLRKSGRARIAAIAAVAIAVGTFASLAATGYAARFVAFTHTSPVAAQYPPSKVTICHHTHSQKNPFVTITVSVHALPAHLKHGDTIGPCTQQAAPAAPVVAAKSQKMHKAHKAKHSNKGQLHGHGNAAKTNGAKSHGHGQGQGNSAHGQTQAPTSPSTVHGKGHAKNTTHGKATAPGQNKTHGQGQGHGQGQSNGHGQGQGGQGQGQGGTHGGNSGGGKGNGH